MECCLLMCRVCDILAAPSSMVKASILLERLNKIIGQDRLFDHKRFRRVDAHGFPVV